MNAHLFVMPQVGSYLLQDPSFFILFLYYAMLKCKFPLSNVTEEKLEEEEERVPTLYYWQYPGQQWQMMIEWNMPVMKPLKYTSAEWPMQEVA